MSSRNIDSSRPSFDNVTKFSITQTRRPSWTWGQGGSTCNTKTTAAHVEIDPSSPDRSATMNYKLLISGIVPRPVGFLSTQSSEGTSKNLAPFSYTQVINHDPPIFVVGFAGSKDKDTLRNLRDTGECVINVISEDFVDAANATAVDAPYGMSEWQLSGLTPAACTQVQAERVKESLFSIEGKVIEIRDFQSRFTAGVRSGSMALIEGVNFWVREDAMSPDQTTIDISVLRPVARLGGIMYGRVNQGFEVPRPRYQEHRDQLNLFA